MAPKEEEEEREEESKGFIDFSSQTSLIALSCKQPVKHYLPLIGG
jgi:hypothetical protein